MLTLNNICVVIVTYNPGINLYSQIEKFNQKKIENIFIVDNSETKSEIFDKIEKLENVNLIKLGQNKGIATALNIAIDICNKADWFLFFDQDTIILDNFLDELFNLYKNIPNKNTIGILSLSTNNLPLIKYKIVDYCITSGSLINKKIFLKVGKFKDEYFIDNVDLEFCLRIKNHGYISYKSPNATIIHNAGNPTIFKFQFFRFSTSNHNAFRRYYMSRNHILLTRKYFFKFPFFILKLNYFFLLALFKMILLENDTTNKISNTIKGLKDGFIYPNDKL